MDIFSRSGYIRGEFELRAEFVRHRTEECVVTYSYKAICVFNNRYNKPVFVKLHGVLAQLLHKLVGADVARFLVEILYHRGAVLCQMANNGGIALFNVSNVHDEFVLFNNVSRRGYNVLDRRKRRFYGIYPSEIQKLFHSAVGELEFIVRSRELVHKILIELGTGKRAYHAFGIFKIYRINQRFFLALFVLRGIVR